MKHLEWIKAAMQLGREEFKGHPLMLLDSRDALILRFPHPVYDYPEFILDLNEPDVTPEEFIAILQRVKTMKKDE